MSPERSPITTHILDLNTGLPAAGVSVNLITPTGHVLGPAVTDADGRVNQWPEPLELTEGLFQLQFELERWFNARGERCFFPEVVLTFKVDNSRPQYHVPLLVNCYGYSTYRGS